MEQNRVQGLGNGDSAAFACDAFGLLRLAPDVAKGFIHDRIAVERDLYQLALKSWPVDPAIKRTMRTSPSFWKGS